MTRRYALYWAPEPDDPLWQAGCTWLGRDPAAQAGGTPPPLRREPWRYGLHATLKAPLALADGAEAAAFTQAVAALAARLAPVVLPPLEVGTLEHFVALRPARPSPALARLAWACVTGLDRWRRPMDPAEFMRRASGLDDERRALLRRWGYPHVGAHWRFHLTLSDPLDAAAREALRRDAERHFAPVLHAPRTLRSLCVFEEPAPGLPLVLTQRHALGGGRGIANAG